MNKIKPLLILILGVGMLLVALRGLFTGTLPAGRGGWGGTRELSREQQPLGFWIMFVADAALGVICLRYGAHLL